MGHMLSSHSPLPPICSELTKLKSDEYVEYLFENGEGLEPHVCTQFKAKWWHTQVWKSTSMRMKAPKLSEIMGPDRL